MRDDKLLTRIAGLLRQAENTDNEHEAETFMQAAQRLATSASIDLAVARAHDPAARRTTTPITRQIAIGETGKRGLKTYVQLFVAIARANDVTVDVAGTVSREHLDPGVPAVRDHAELVKYLRPLGAGRRWTNSATNIAAAVMFGLMILAAVVLWVLVWRGHLG